ncbi:haloalkane dehalogenase [Leptospira kmetyi]|uniref:Alpha/beta fold hydrolase n=1 Tax=Leptospira kmetyi TaxID=408139 RepID=A0A2M9XRC7_9LEPT|nr:haloalkane dehalogenase [Leptospira kmetyi]AYV57935.1 alpha/beta fold hydrolase [Leptospira kmetyi]PJZ27852.1 haloalkane dehalogenase [Leptospira kmetyi]PJZ41852.1 haloalkane dehalogenase [Leptospira kmetyi]TGK14936.1 alpha/beta fold hydrolase [Leptospira kmetyi]TGK33449.1 alpha/beta fold hydrolase [Leptospira kmetyi]
MEILRTPDSSFENLPGYSFTPNYLQVQNLRMHYVDEGPKDASETVLLLHGEPSWSYLYRKMIPPLARAGYRTIAPDLIGFGKSDKPDDPSFFSYQAHVDWLREFVENLDLKNVTLFCQDWGGLLGLRVAAEHSERFSRIVAANTFLPTGDIPPKEDFLKWRHFSQNVKRLAIGSIVKNGCVSELTKEIVAAYDSPYPNETYKAAAKKFPALVPISPDDPASEPNRKAWEILKTWKKPFLTAFSDQDPITKGGDIFFRRLIPGAKGQKHVTIANGGHFLQEDKGEELAEVVIQFIKANPL